MSPNFMAKQVSPDLNNNIDSIELTDIHRTFYPADVGYTSFSSALG